MPPYPRSSDDDITTDSDDSDATTATTTDDDDDTTTDDESSSDEANFSPAPSGAVVKNAPHDEEFSVAGAGSASGPAPAAAGRPAAAAAAPAAVGQGAAVQNQPHDEEFDVAGGASSGSGVPPRAAAGGRPAGGAAAGGARGGQIHNDHADEFEEPEDDMSDEDMPTPQKGPAPSGASGASGAALAPVAAGGRKIDNDHIDEEYTVAPSTTAPSNAQRGVAPAPVVQPSSSGNVMAPPSDDDTDEDSSDADSDDSEESDAGEAPTMQNIGPVGTAAPAPAGPSNEYNPADYAHITNQVPGDVRDLFSYITAYQPTTMELPAKLKPFVPEFIPSVGDIDTFCKIPRPDDKTDNFGLTVVDEPGSKMSNPAVVTAMIAHLENVSTTVVEGILDTLEDAATRPQAVDRWIDDLRETQAKKAPPTVYYSKPMPSIDSLMQEWPQGFEQVLSSDLQLPPPGIDLDMEQYVKMLCAILDIPVHNNLVESLHVMFTLYLEFRENQHFKAA